MAEAEINAFVMHLAVVDEVSASKQTQAVSAILYRFVLHREVGELEDLVRAQKPKRLPVVLSREEVPALLEQLHRTDPRSWLIASLLNGAGLRFTERLRLRVLDVSRRELIVRDGKGGKDRATTLPRALEPALRDQLRCAPAVHEADLAAGWGRVQLPHALARTYPRAPAGVAPAVGLPPARRQRRRPARRRRQARHLPHAPPRLRHPPARDGSRHPHDPGAPRPQRRRRHDDLHARPQPRRPRCARSAPAHLGAQVPPEGGGDV